jgi:hypothetical protein
MQYKPLGTKPSSNGHKKDNPWSRKVRKPNPWSRPLAT